MNASTSTIQLIKFCIIATTANIEEQTDRIVYSLSSNFDLLKRSKVYLIRDNFNEARVYLTFQLKEGGGVQLQPGDVVKGS